MQVIRKQNLANSFFNGLPFKVQKLQGSTYWYQTCFSHSFIHYPIESQLTLGNERRGCFEEVSETREPSTGITCLDIVPIESPHNLTDPSQMETLCQRFHPDSQNQQRYVTGTRIQTRGKGKKKSHKLNTCQFHNLDNCSQGAEVKTMSQGDFLFIFIHWSVHKTKCDNLWYHGHTSGQKHFINSKLCSFVVQLLVLENYVM